MEEENKRREISRQRFFCITAGALLVLELTVRAATVKPFGGIGLIMAVCSALAAAIIISLATLLIEIIGIRSGKWGSGRAKLAAGSVCLVTGLILYGGQVVYNQIFHTYYTVYSMLHGGQVAQFWRDILIGMEDSAAYLVIMLAAVCAAVALLRGGYEKKADLTLKKAAACLGCGALALCILCSGIIASTKEEVNSPYDMWFRTNSIDGSIANLGVGTAMCLDTYRLIFGFTGQVVLSEEEVEEIELQPQYDMNMTVDFDALIDAETDKTLLSMHQYFDSQVPTLQNEKTGIFAGKNLVFITAESLAPYAIDPVYTPTLYKLQHEGFYFENFYNPIWGVSTSDGEYVACQGLLPKAGVWSMQESAKNYLPYTMGNQFSKLGYKTLAYHDHYAEYYGRTESHPNMGYVYKGLGTGLKVTEMWPESDLQMLELTTPTYLTPDESGKIEPFHVYYMTVSGHLNYNFRGQAMCVRHREDVADLNMSEPCRAYLACNIELDLAMEKLLADLEAAGELDNTVIAISPDHYPYGLPEENISEFLGHEVDPVFEIYKSCLIIYNSAMEPETVEKVCCSMDIIPTLSNLFGLEYDSRLLMGKDIFSTATPLVIFKDKSWITGRAFYNAQTKEVTETDGEVSESYIANINNTVANKFNFSRLILEKNYYGKIKDAL